MQKAFLHFKLFTAKHSKIAITIILFCDIQICIFSHSTHTFALSVLLLINPYDTNCYIVI